MTVEANYVLGTIAVGLGATLFMDLWALLMKRAFGVASADYCLVGRWFRHIPEGTFVHASIARAPQRSFECTVGWVAHYVIGLAYALMLVGIVSIAWLAQPTLLPALLFGVGSIVAPFFVMHPAFGLGIAASKTPAPTRARLRSLMAHVSFGVGLYVSAIGVSYVVPSA